MIILILVVVACIAAYYFMKKELTEKYSKEFVKSVRWMLISPLVQVPVLAFAAYFAIDIHKMLDMALAFQGFPGLLGDAFMTSQAYDSDFQDVVLKLGFTSVLGYVAVVLLIITTVIQVRGIYDYSKKRRIKAAHIVAFVATVCLIVCNEWASNNVKQYASISSDDTSIFFSYFTLAVTVLLLGLFAAQFASAANRYYKLRNENLATKQAADEQPSATATHASSKVEQLQGLKSMLDQGILTQEEFDNEKRKLLNQ